MEDAVDADRARCRQYYFKHREAILAKRAQYRADNAERIKEAKRKHYREHREEVLAARAAYVAANRDAVRRGDADYCRRHKDRRRIRNAEWRKRNWDRVAALRAAYRARRRGARFGDREAYRQVIVLIRTAPLLPCFWCGALTLPDNRHVDHAIPLSKGGPDSEENPRCACTACNLRKKDKLPEQFLLELQRAA